MPRPPVLSRESLKVRTTPFETKLRSGSLGIRGDFAGDDDHWHIYIVGVVMRLRGLLALTVLGLGLRICHISKSREAPDTV